MRRDSIFYQLFVRYPALLFDLLPQPPARAAEYTFEASEVKETAFRMDGVFMPPDRAGIVYFCEVQFQPDETLYERMVSEIGIYVYRHRERFSDWQAVVIYPNRSMEQSRLETVRDLLASGRIRRVYLDELGEIERLPMNTGLMVLTILEGDEAKAEARRTIERSGGDRDIIELVSTIIVYKFSNLTRDEVNAMLGINLEQTRVYQEAKAEGESIGETREALNLILRLLNRRIGSMSIELQERVKALPLERLENLGEALLDFTNLTDLETWLSQN
jgi:predicted transposase/invertase (TIGR01784 family)